MALVSAEQISAMMDFLEGNPELALGRCNRSIEGRCKARRLWQEGAVLLNSISPNCHRKEPDAWRVWYSEFKAKMLKKIKAQKAERFATGGGPAQKIILTAAQERLYTLLGRDVGEPLPGIRQNPLEHEVLPLAGENDQYVMREVELPVASDEEELRDNFVEDFPRAPSPPQPQPTPSTSRPVQVWSNRTPLTLRLPQSSTLTLPSSSRPVQARDNREPSPSIWQSNSGSPSTLAGGPTPTQARSERRHSRQLRGRRRRQVEVEVDSQPQLGLESAYNRLSESEQTTAAATLEHARATDRLAAAVERLAEAITQAPRVPLTREEGVPEKKRCRRRFILESDSD